MRSATAAPEATGAVQAIASGPARSTPRRLVLFGDSLIYATGLPAGEDFAAVISRDRPDLDVLDAGVPGNRTSDALARTRNVTDSHPAVVVIWLGTNDAVTDFPVESFAAELTQILDLLQPAREVLVTPINVRLAPQAYKPYAEAVRQIAAQRGIGLVDLEPVITANDYIFDGVHLNAAAVVRVAKLMEQQIG